MKLTKLYVSQARQTTELINSAYTEDEAGIWKKGVQRTNEKEVKSLLENEELFGFLENDIVLAVGRITKIKENIYLIGMISLKRGYKGKGIPGKLMREIHKYLESINAKKATLDLLTPITWKHPQKEKLFGWYSKLGYEVIREAKVEEVVPGGLKDLATECKFIVMEKEI